MCRSAAISGFSRKYSGNGAVTGERSDSAPYFNQSHRQQDPYLTAKHTHILVGAQGRPSDNLYTYVLDIGQILGLLYVFIRGSSILIRVILTASGDDTPPSVREGTNKPKLLSFGTNRRGGLL